MLPAQPNQSLIDGLGVLQALASAGRAVGSREMARELKLESTRVNRLLKTLAHLGIAEQTADKRYVPGPAMHVLAAQAMFGSGLLLRAIGPLATLSATKLSVALGVLWRDRVAYLYHADPAITPAKAIGRVGLFPATRSGIGMVLLSRMSDADVRRLYLDVEPEPFNTVDDLLPELQLIRRQGYALVRPFADQSRCTLAVAIDDESAAVALSGDWSADRLAELIVTLRTVATDLANIDPPTNSPTRSLS